MAAAFRVSVEALGFSGSACLVDEQSLATASGAGLRVLHVADGAAALSGKPQLLALPVGGGVSALAASPWSRTLVAAVASGRAPTLLVFSGASAPHAGGNSSAPPATPPVALALSPPADATVSAVAVSRDGRRIVSFGSAPYFALVVHEQLLTADGTSVPWTVSAASDFVRAPGLVTRALLCPGNADLLAAAGPSGLFFYRLKRSHDKLEALLTRAAPVTAPSLAPLATSDTESTAEAAQAILQDAADAAAADAAASGIDASAAAAAAAAVASRRGAHVWLCAAWLSEGALAAGNAAGDVVVFAPETGEVLAQLPLTSRLGGAHAFAHSAASPLVATAMAATAQMLIVGCSDGCVRYLALPARAAANEGALFASPFATAGHILPLAAIVRLATTAPSSLPSQPGGDAASHSAEAVVCVEVSVSGPTQRAFAGTAAGSLHALPMGAALLALVARQQGAQQSSLASSSFAISALDLSAAPQTVLALLDQPPLRTVASVCVAGLSSVGGGSSSSSSSYYVTADAGGLLRAWVCEGGAPLTLVAKAMLSSATAAAAPPSKQHSPVPRRHHPAVHSVEDAVDEGDATGADAELDDDSVINVTGAWALESKEGKEADLADLEGPLGLSPAAIADSEPATVHRATAEPVSAPAVSMPPPLHITALAAHAQLPIVAVGASDGSVTLLLLQRAAALVQVMPLHRDFAHAAPVTSLTFAPRGTAEHLLISVSAAERLLVVHDVAAAAEAPRPSAGGAATIARAVAHLPCKAASAATAAVHDPHAVSAMVCVPSADREAPPLLLLGCASGHVLSLALPAANAPAAAVANLTALLQLRGRLPSGIVALAATEAAPRGVPAMVFVALAGEKTLAVVPLDAGHLPAQPLSAAMLADTGGAFAAVPAATKPVFSLNAHKRAAAAVALSPVAGASAACLVASGGRDGAVTLLSVSITAAAGAAPFKLALAGSAYVPLHAGPVTALRFAADGRSLLASSPAGDGLCHLLTLDGDAVENAEAAASGKGAASRAFSPAESSLLQALHVQAVSSAVAAAVAEFDSAFKVASHVAADGVDATRGGAAVPLLVRVHAAAEAASRSEHGEVHAALLGEVESFRARLHAMLAANEAARPLERLERREFVIDAAGRDAILAEYEAKADFRKRAYDAEAASLDADAARLRAACVDALEAQACEVRALTTEAAVRNFPVRRRLPADWLLMDRLATLRTVELDAMQFERGAERPVSGTAAAFAWEALATRLPSDTDWVYHCGLLSPTTDPAKQHDEILAAKAAGTKRGAGAAGATDGSSGEGVAAGSEAVAPKKGDKAAKETDEKEGPKGVAWEGEAVVRLLYHPAAVRTPSQKRLQARLLAELVRATQLRFNVQFEKLRNDKIEVLDAIRVRHARVRDILLELGTPVAHMTEKDQRAQELARLTGGSPATAVAVFIGAIGSLMAGPPSSRPVTRERPASGGVAAAAVVAALRTPIGPVSVMGADGALQAITDPYLATSEDPASVLKVSDAEVGIAPYVSPAEQRRRLEEEARRKQAAAANKDDAPERALQDMMNGTLEGKDELTALAESLVREPWMDEVPEDKMTPEQKTQLAAYEKLAASLEDERAKARNTLQAELTKLVGELKDVVEAFEAKVVALARTRALTASIVQAQEMYIVRLSASAQLREDNAAKDRALGVQSDVLMPVEDASVQAHETFKVGVELLQREVEELTARDRALETGFKAALKEGGHTLDNDLFRVVLALFKKRDTAAAAMQSREAAAAAAELQALRETAAASLLPAGAPAPGLQGLPSMRVQPATLQRQGSATGKKSMAASLASPASLGASSHLPADSPLTRLRPDLDSDPFAYAHDSAGRSLELEGRQQAAREAALLPLQKADLPEGFEDLLTEPLGLFTLLASLRRDKVASELALGVRTRALDAMKAHLALLAARYETNKVAIDSIQSARDAIINARELGHNDVELLLRLRMGQDEVSANNFDCTPHALGGAAEVEWQHAIFAPAEVVEAINGDVRRLGQVKVDSLGDIKAFRKGLMYQKWEAQYRQARADDEHEFHRDLQLMRPVGPVLQFITGINIALKARQDIERAEAKIAHMRKSHERALLLTDKAVAKLDTAVEQRQKAIASLSHQTVQLREGVALREAILRSRGGGGAGAGAADSEGGAGGAGAAATSAAEDKLRAVAQLSKLQAVTRQQAAEIKQLRAELATALERSFPTFGAR